MSAAPTIADLISLHSPQAAATTSDPLRESSGQASPRFVAAPQPAPPSPATDRDTFAALDNPAAPPTTTWIHTSAHHAEAGYLDPSLGWVSVRADANSTGLHAAIMPGSPEAASALGNHLAGLNAFLAEHHGRSATVTLAPEAASAFSGGSSLAHAGNGHQDSHRQPDRNTAQSASETGTSTPLRDSGSIATRSFIPQPIAGIPALNGNGVHLSVMA